MRIYSLPMAILGETKVAEKKVAPWTYELSKLSAYICVSVIRVYQDGSTIGVNNE